MSTPDQPGHEKEIFEHALDLTQPEARLAYLQQACHGDAGLLDRVQTLLRAEEVPGDFLPPTSRFAADAGAAEKGGIIGGRYKLLEKIGEGGFGSVYMAEQEAPVRRRVALKVIKLGMDTREVVARFEAERQALAMMDHPNIAKVLDAGATDTGRPYFVMELVKGLPITTYCDQRRLSTLERLELFILVCQAVQHAHQKGVIHRDLKPSNILVTEQDGRPVPKVIDFGVARATQARLTEKTMFTQFHQMVGTPAYMSPEQTGLGNLDIDTRSDIYSLGVLLYELLTGCTPFDAQKLHAAGYEGIMRIIREVEPPKPSTRLSSLSLQELSALGGRRHEEPARLGRLVEGDLDWIVMKALEKDRMRRYETAASLAQDLQRHLGNEPVLARPASNFYRFKKWRRRNRLLVASATAIAATLVLGATVATWLAVRATRAEREAKKQAATSDKVAHFAAGMWSGVGPAVLHGSDTTLLKQMLDRAAERLAIEMADEPAVQAWLYGSLGAEYMNLEDYAAAEPHLRRRLTLLQQLRRDDHEDVVDALGSLSLCIGQLGKTAEAENLARRAVTIARESRGSAAKLLPQLLDTLAEVRRAQRDFSGAADLGREAVAIARQRFDPVSPELADVFAASADFEKQVGNLRESEALAREALAIRRKCLPREDPNLVDSLSAVAAIAMTHGEHAEAEAMLREILAIQRQLPDTSFKYTVINRTLGTLAETMMTRGDLTGAETLCRENLEAVGKFCRPDVDTIGMAHLHLFRVLRKRGDLAGAETEIRAALASWKQLAARQPGLEFTALALLGSIRLERGDLTQAEEYCREALALSRQNASADRIATLGPLNQLAKVQAARGDLTGEVTSRREALEICRQNLPVTRNDLPICLNHLAGSLLKQAAYPEAELLLSEAQTAEDALKYHRQPVQQQMAETRVQLYTAWTKADPSKAALAAEWQHKLDQFSPAGSAPTSPTR